MKKPDIQMVPIPHQTTLPARHVGPCAYTHTRSSEPDPMQCAPSCRNCRNSLSVSIQNLDLRGGADLRIDIELSAQTASIRLQAAGTDVSAMEVLQDTGLRDSQRHAPPPNAGTPRLRQGRRRYRPVDFYV